MALKIVDNPVITKELRSRMRGSRAYWVLFAYLIILSIALFLSYLSWWNQHNAGNDMGASTSFTAGRQFFIVLFCVQALLISLIMPALTSGSISIEREQRTFELLRSTILPTRSIVVGKLFSSLSFVGLLLTASLPLISICFLLGGVSPDQVGVTYLLLLLDAFVYGAVGLAWSASAGGTATATAMSYASLFAYFIVTAPFAISGISRFYGSFGGTALSLAALNPVGAIAGADKEMYYSWQLSAWFPALVVNGLLAALMMTVAAARLSDSPGRIAPLVRGLLFLFVACALFFLDGSPALATTPALSAVVLAIAGLIALVLFAPPFVTGNPAAEDPDNAPTGNFVQKILFRTDLKVGTPTVLFLAVMISAITAIAFSLWRSTFSVTTLSATVPLAVGISYCAIAFAMAGCGKWLSVALRNRWAAMVILYVLTAMLMIIPYVSYNTSQQMYNQVTPGPSFADNMLYFCPLVSYQELCFNGGTGYAYTLLPAQKHLLLAPFPDWIVMAALYAILGAVFFTLATVVERRGARKSAPIQAAAAS